MVSLFGNDHTIHCAVENCPLGSAVIAPLKQRGETIGTLKVYYPSEKAITDVSVELIAGLSSLLSDQLEIANAEKAYQLAKEAEIKALQAQISPHFLFNTINIIISLIRTNPDQARKLLTSLSYFLRQNLEGTTATKVSLEQELQHVNAYLQIEEARFVDKLTITSEVDDNILNVMIPPLTLQPIVENAIKHGIKEMKKDSVVKISLQEVGSVVEIQVHDNGIGITPERLSTLGSFQIESTNGIGMGLYNVNRRLIMTFGEQAALQIQSNYKKGTCVSFCIPKKEDIN
jgi:two-component system sensor histidine kinase LytS